MVGLKLVFPGIDCLWLLWCLARGRARKGISTAMKNCHPPATGLGTHREEHLSDFRVSWLHNFLPIIHPPCKSQQPYSSGPLFSSGPLIQSCACGQSHCGLKAWGTVGRGGGPARPLWRQSALLLNKQTLCSCTAFRVKTVGDKTISSSLSQVNQRQLSPGLPGLRAPV